MPVGKAPSRVIDGPYAQWDNADVSCQIVLSNNSSIKIGQPVCLDVTQLGPDNNVPNNNAALPLCERVVATTSANAGPVFGVVSAVNTPVSSTFKLSYVNGFNANQTILNAQGGVPTYTNTTGANFTVTISVRQQGFAYVLAGTAAIGQTGGNSILVGSQLVTTSAQIFGIQGTAAIQTTIGVALATAINTAQASPQLAAAGAGVVSVFPTSMVGIVPNAGVLVDTLASGIQESVSVGSISYPTFSIALNSQHSGGFIVKGPNAGNEAKNSVLISTPGAGVTVSGLVGAWIALG